MVRLRLFIIALLLGGCGGENSGTNNQPSSQSNSPPASGTLVFPNANVPSLLELSGAIVTAQSVPGEFNSLNRRSQINDSGVSAEYTASFIAQKGVTKQYITGGARLQLDYLSGTGIGFISDLDISGADTFNRGFKPADTLQIIVTSISGGRMSGSISGTITDYLAVDGETFDNYVIDAVLTAQVVTGDAVVPAYVGTVEGTISSGLQGTELLRGVVAGEKCFTSLC